jgi:hypothetical protein
MVWYSFLFRCFTEWHHIVSSSSGRDPQIIRKINIYVPSCEICGICMRITILVPNPVAARSKARYTLSVNLSDFAVWCHIWRKNWVNCIVLVGNSAGHRTVLFSRLSHRELRTSIRESHGFLSLPSDTTLASSQGTFVSSNSFSRWASHDIFLFKYHFLLHIWSFLFFFSDNIATDVTSKQQMIDLFISPT